MSFNSLNIGASALYAAQRAAEIAANNVANANTPGYTRQRLQLDNAPATPGSPGEYGDGMIGNGVVMVGVSRMRDMLADLAYRSETATAGAADARADVLGRAETVLGTYPDGAAKALNDFFTSWTALSNTPTSGAARSAVLNAGQTLAQSLNQAAAQLTTIGNDTVAVMTDSVTQVNGLAKHVAELNEAIAEAVTSGQTPNDLMDQRDTAIDQLSKLTGATVKPSTAGRVDVYLASSPLVHDGDARSVTLTRTGSAYTLSFTDGPAVVGGALGGYARALTVDLPAASAQLDQVAASLATAVNTVHAASYSLNGTPGTPDGGNFFTGTTADTISVRAGLTPDGIAASRTGADNDGSAALDMGALSSGDATSVGSLLRGLMGQLGSLSQEAQASSATAKAGLDTADQQRGSLNGVNLNEETADLVKFQHSYEAAARVISMADGFLDTIINHMGAGR